MFNLSKIKDASWFKKLLNSYAFPILWGILTVIMALSVGFAFTFVTNNFFIIYLTVEITIFAMLIILCGKLYLCLDIDQLFSKKVLCTVYGSYYFL